MPPLPKMVFACKAAASTAEMSARVTSVLHAGEHGLVAPEGKPLEDAFGVLICSCLLCTERGNGPALPPSDRLPVPDVTLDS